MREMRVRQRWLPVPYGVYGVLLAFVFGGIAVAALLHPEDGPSVRIALPMYGIAVYWVLAALVNVRSVFIREDRVAEYVWPVPIRLPRWTRREEIRYCTIRRVVVFDDGTALEVYYTAGLERLDGLESLVSGPHKTREEAEAVAREIAGVLQVPVVEVDQIPKRGQVIRIILAGVFWLTLAVTSVFVGAAWDEEYQRGRRSGEGKNPGIEIRFSGVYWGRPDLLAEVQNAADPCGSGLPDTALRARPCRHLVYHQRPQ